MEQLSGLTIDTPLGLVSVVSAPAGVQSLVFGSLSVALVRAGQAGGSPIPDGDPHDMGQRVQAYFRGELDAFDGVACAAAGTPFQQRVWAELRQIRVGQTWSYRELAIRIGRPTASRAVGGANRRNPVALVIPCHRVIATGGALSGYAFGTERKRWLLAHEGAPAWCERTP